MATIDDLHIQLQQLNTLTLSQGGIVQSLLNGILTNSTNASNTLTTIAGNLKNPTGGGGGGAGPGSGPQKPKGLLHRLGGMFKRGGGILSKAGKKGGIGSVMGGAMGSKAKGAGAIAGAAALAEGLYEAGKAAVQFAYEQEGVARRLAEISPSQAAAIAELDVNRMQRDLETGEDTAPSAKGLTDSINRFEQATQPLEKAAIELKNTVGSVLMDILSDVVEAVTDLAKRIEYWNNPDAWKKYLEDKKAEKEGPELLGGLFERIAEDQERKDRAAKARIDAARKADERRKRGL